MLTENQKKIFNKIEIVLNELRDIKKLLIKEKEEEIPFDISEQLMKLKNDFQIQYLLKRYEIYHMDSKR